LSAPIRGEPTEIWKEKIEKFNWQIPRIPM
jgi:hypothetical protein